MSNYRPCLLSTTLQKAVCLVGLRGACGIKTPISINCWIWLPSEHFAHRDRLGLPKSPPETLIELFDCLLRVIILRKLKVKAEIPSVPHSLVQAIAKAGLTDEDNSIVRCWLAEQLEAQEYAKLGQGGHTNTQVPLRQVFVDLPIAANPNTAAQRDERTLFLDSLLNAGPLDLRNAYKTRTDISIAAREDNDDEEDEGEIIEASLHQRHFPWGWCSTLLIGGPGQGKSTLTQLACQLHRAALVRPHMDQLTSTQRDLVDTFVTSGEEGAKNPESLGLPVRPLIPLQVILPDFVAWVARSKENSAKDDIPILLQFLADLPSAKAVGLEAAKLFKLICAMPSFLVLDGFDEVGATQDRNRIVSAAREFLSTLSDHAAACQVLATTRPQGYADELAQAGVKFQKVFLIPLLKEEALEYATKLIAAKISGADQQAKALRQIREAAAEPATRRLLTTPLQVTILTALVQQLGRAPRERWNLFYRYFAYTFDREIERNTFASALLAEHRAHIERIHARVALLLQVEAERDGGASARMTRERLENVISEVLAEDEVAVHERKELVREIAQAAEMRLVFLVEPEPGNFGFEIRSLQEFMAAWALTTGRDSEIEARLQQVASAPMFRNVALFIASKLFSEGSPLRDILADRICGSLDENAEDELLRASRAGALLALETLEEGAALSQPKRARSLMSRAVGILALPPGQEHIRLARIANEDTWPVLRKAIELGLSGDAKDERVCIASAWTTVIDASNRGETWAVEVGEQFWADSAARSTFVGAFTRANVPLGRWISKNIEAHSVNVRPEVFVDSTPLRGANGSTSSWVAWLAYVFGSGAEWRQGRREGWIPVAQSRGKRTSYERPSYAVPQGQLWAGWLTAANYECDPSAENLAITLDEMAKGPPAEYWRALGWRCSWPLATCIAYANTAEDFVGMAQQLRAGELGDVKQWSSAQKNWKDTLDLVKVLELGRGAGPWNLQAISTVPPVLALPLWRYIERYGSRTRKYSAADLLNVASEIFESTKSNTLKARMAELALANWRSLPNKASRKNFDPFKWLHAVPATGGLLVPRPRYMSVSEWIELLDKCDSEVSYPWLVSPETVLKSLGEVPLHPFLLALAAHTIGIYSVHYGDGEGVQKIAKEALDAIPADSPIPAEARASIAVLKFLVGDHPSSADSQLLDDVTKGAQDDSTYWSSLLGALRLSHLPDSRVDAILVSLYRAVGANGSIAQEAMKEIRDSLQKRTSGLDSESAWQRLALPLPYPKIPAAEKMEGDIPLSPIQLHKMELQDIGGIAKLSLELAPTETDAGQWTVIIGANGVGKTTFLRSLALALRNVRNPSIWPKGAFSRSWQRTSGSEESPISSSQIVVTLADGAEHRTVIRPGNFVTITQHPEQERPRLFPIFAYGCRRGSALGGNARQVNLNDDDGPEIATLFDEGADLIQAETWLVALEGDVAKSARSKIIYHSVTLALKKLMNLESIAVREQRLWVKEKNRPEIPFGFLSDGYLTNAGWFLDLLARWVTLADRNNIDLGDDFLTKMRGLVLVDEIDLHLHPQWQIEVIARTRELLPAMSFVVTTHNPLTLVGAQPEEIWILDRTDDGLEIRSGVETPMLLTGGQIYHQYFGINDIYPNGLGKLLQRYSYLSGFALRNDDEQQELEDIQAKLASAKIDPGWDVIPQAKESPLEMPKAQSKKQRNA